MYALIACGIVLRKYQTLALLNAGVGQMLTDKPQLGMPERVKLRTTRYVGDSLTHRDYTVI